MHSFFLSFIHYIIASECKVSLCGKQNHRMCMITILGELNVWWERQSPCQRHKSVDAIVETPNLSHELRVLCPRRLRISPPVTVFAWVILFKDGTEDLHFLILAMLTKEPTRGPEGNTVSSSCTGPEALSD